MIDREKVISWVEGIADDDEWHLYHSDSEVRKIAKAVLGLLKEQQQQIWEFQDQVEYLTDKLKEQETELCDRCGRRRLRSIREGR